MRRWIAYLSVFVTVWLFCAGVWHLSAERGCVRIDTAQESPETEIAARAVADFAWWDSYAWYVVPAGDPVSMSCRTTGGMNAGVRCWWLTGLKRELSSPVFQAADILLTYLGRRSSARSFASWRASLCGASCGDAVSVSRPGDGYIYALRRIVI